MSTTTKKTNWIDYRELKARVGVLDVLGLFNVEVPRPDGTQHYMSCPLPCHGGDGNNPNAFSANSEKGCWRCFTSCGSGNVIDLYARFAGHDPKNPQEFRAAAVELHERMFGESDDSSDDWKNEPDDPEAPAADLFEKDSAVVREESPSSEEGEEEPESDEATENMPLPFTLTVKSNIPFLTEEKNFPLELVSEFEIGWVNKGMMSGRVVVPIHNEVGDLVAYAGRGMKKEDIIKRGRWMLPKKFRKSLELFNQHRAAERDIPSQGLVVVEGFWSALRWHQAGFPVVALMGCEISEYQSNRIAELTNEVWLMLDNDKAGNANRGKIAAALSSHVAVRTIAYPEDSWSQPERFTPDELRSLMQG